MNTTETSVGTITIPGREIHDASYETAAWYRTFVFETQTVPVRPWRNFYLWTVEGRTTYEYFPSLWGGVPIGNSSHSVGPCDKPSTYTFQVYDYIVAEMAERGEIQLAEGYRIQESWFDHQIYCMGYVTQYVEGKAIYEPCAHTFHNDPHGNPLTTRNDRGHLPDGYDPVNRDRKRHVKVVPV